MRRCASHCTGTTSVGLSPPYSVLVAHFIASTLLTLVSWCIQTQAMPTPDAVQTFYTTLIRCLLQRSR